MKYLLWLMLFNLMGLTAVAQSEECSLPERLTIGQMAQVTEITSANRVRAAAGLGGTVLGEIPPGAIFRVMSGSICADGYRWWQVQYADINGWTAEGGDGQYWLEPLEILPPVPLADDAITAANVEQIASTARLGSGYINAVAWSLDGETLAVATSIDLSLYPLDGSERQVLSEGAVNDVAYSPDGRWLAAAFEDGYAQLYDTATGEVKLELPIFQSVSAIAFSLDGSLLATGLRRSSFASNDAAIHVWDVATGEQVASQSAKYDPEVIRFVPDSSALVFAGFAEVSIWDYQTAAVEEIEGSPVFDWAVSPDGRYVVSASDDISDIQYLRLYDRETGEFSADITTETRQSGASQTYFTPDGLLLTVNPDGTLVARDLPALRVIETLAENVATAVFSPDGESLAVSQRNGIVRLFATPRRGDNGRVSMEALAVFNGLSAAADELFFSPDGAYLAASDNTHELIVWQVIESDGRKISDQVAHWDNFTPPITTLAFSPDDSRVAAGGRNASVYVWDHANQTPETVFSGHEGEITAVAFNADGTQIATGDETFTRQRTLHIWEAASGESIASQPNEGTGLQGPDELFYLTNGTWMVAQFFDVASGNDPSLLWRGAVNGAGLSLEDVLPLHRQGDGSSAKTIAITRDGRLMAIGYRSGIVRLTDPISGTAYVTLPNPDSFQAELSAFSGDGRRLTVSYRALDGGGNPLTMIVIWDTQTGAEITRFHRQLDSVNALAMNADGSLVTLGMKLGTVIIYNAGSGEYLSTLLGQAEAISDLIFSHDGSILAAASDDGTIRLCSLPA